jgi:hypothetical protein
MTDIDDAQAQPFSPLVGAFFTQMAASTAAATDAVLDIRKAQLRDARAELYAIRQGIAALLGHPWTPSSEAVSQAVFAPAQHLREEYLERYAEEDE